MFLIKVSVAKSAKNLVFEGFLSQNCLFDTFGFLVSSQKTLKDDSRFVFDV
jgi:hypothetical protein